MTIWTPIAFAFGVIMFMAFTFLYCYWRVRHVRTTRLSSIQVSAIIPEAPQQQHQLPKQQLVGIEKDVLDAFPTIKANELKVGIQEENSQCSICLVEYAASEVLRQLPICGHIFHTSCVDSWLQKQPTCPVCRILLSPKLSSEAAATAASPSPPATPSWVLVNQPVPLPPATTTPFSSAAASSSSIGISTKASSSPTSDLEIGNNFHHQGRIPLNGSSVEYPLRMKVAEEDLGSSSHLTVGGWGSSGFLDAAAVVSDNSCSKLQGGNRQQKSCRTSHGSCCTSNIQIQSRGIKNPSINSRRWLTESFSFVLSDSFNPDNVMQEHQLQLPGGGGAYQAISIDNKSPTTTTVTTAAEARTKPCTDLGLRASSLPIMPMPSMGFSSSRSSKKKKQMMLQQEGSMLCHSSPADSESVFESRVSDSHLPLTISPEQCSFQFLPVLTMGSSCCVNISSFRPVATQH
jgi:hypothetical protein